MDAAADFETTTDPNDCRVWAWGLAEIGNCENFVYGNSIGSFFGYIAKTDVKTIWFHNLGFDGRFIISFLLTHDYEHVTDRPGFCEFATLISSKGQFYQIEVNLGGHRVYFRDSLKLFPMPVARLAETFNLNVSKGDLDYTEYRAPGHELTRTELDYLKRDVLIVAQALEYNYSAGMSRMTIGSNAFADYKNRIGKKQFRRLFPVLDLETDAFIRKSYRGGYVFCNPEYQGKDVSGISVDYTSMYPSQMISHPYPIGEPVYFEGKYTPSVLYPLFVQAFTCTFKLKDKGLPVVQLRGRGFWGNHEYVRETIEPVQLVLTSVDFAVFMEMYDVDILSWDGGYCFQAANGLFDDYVDYWGGVKNNSEGGQRALAKLMLNNLYGKFATNPDCTCKNPILDDSGIVEYALGAADQREPVYIPLGVFVTAYARKELLDAIMKNRERFIYCDTDSMHLLGDGDPEGIPLGNTLGHWKVEGHFSRARHLRAKAYIWDLNGQISVTCAGMPDNVKKLCTFDNFNFGFSNLDSCGEIVNGAGKLLPKNVPGGVVLVESPYVLRQ